VPVVQPGRSIAKFDDPIEGLASGYQANPFQHLGTESGQCADHHFVRTFKAKIGTADETEADLEAILTVGEGQLLITAGDQEIGAWPVGSVNLDLTNRGYRMNIGGEALLVAPVDRFTFREAVDEERESVEAKSGKGRRHSKRAKAGDTTKPTKQDRRAVAKSKNPDESRGHAPKPQREKRAKRNWTSLSRSKERRLSLSAVEPLPAVENDAPWEIPVTKDHVEPDPNQLVSLFLRIPLPWKIGVTGAILAFGAGVVFPRLVATIMLLPGLLAILTAGLGLIDPGYTRKLPASIDEQRLLTVGGILLAVGLMIVTFF